MAGRGKKGVSDYPVNLPIVKKRLLDEKKCGRYRWGDHRIELCLLSAKSRTSGYRFGQVGFYGQLLLWQLRLCLSQSFYSACNPWHRASGIEMDVEFAKPVLCA